MKRTKIIVYGVALLLILSMLSIAIFAKSANPFTDVSDNEYYYDAVLWAFENKITNGATDTTFEPNSNNTRAQMVTFLWRCAGCPEPTATTSSFTDLKEGEYYVKAVLWAVEQGITKGDTETTFNPNGIVSRGQTVTFLYRYENPRLTHTTEAFKDVKDSDYWAYAVTWAFEKGITTGTSDTTFEPDAPCTRGQIVTFLYRLCAERGIIVDNGQIINSLKVNGVDISEYVIACNESAGGVIKNAASELQKYIKLATGVELKIESSPVKAGTKRIYINETLETDIDNFQYFSDDDGITISGSATRGALYGVYHFLEDQLRWRFFASDTETCYQSRLIDLKNLDVEFTASFKVRDVYWTDYFNDSISVKRMQNGEGKRHMDESWGGLDVFTGGGCHTIDGLAETGGGGVGPNPCLSDPDVYNTVLKNVRKLLEENPDAKYIHVSQNDNHTYCTCEKCKAIDDANGSPAGSIVTFVNKIAEAIEKDYPNVIIVTFAYDYSRKCPTNVVCRDNVMIELCSIECCYHHTLDDPNCELNVEFMKDLEAWSKICKQMYIWDYTINFRYFLCPFPNFDVLLQNVKIFRDYNVIGVLEQGCYQMQSPEFGALRSYLLAKAFENPDMTKEEYYNHMNEFLEAYYGPGWQYIKNYIDYFTKLANDKDSCFIIWSDPEVIFGEHPFTEMNDTLIEWFDKAEEMAETDVQLMHVRRSRLCCDWLRVGSIFYQEYKSKDDGRRDNIIQQVKDLYDTCLEFGIYRIGENYPLPTVAETSNYKKNPRRWSGYYDYKE